MNKEIPEYEVKILEIDPSAIEYKLQKLGAELKFDCNTYMEGFDFHENEIKNIEIEKAPIYLRELLKKINIITSAKNTLIENNSYLRIRHECVHTEIILKYRVFTNYTFIKKEMELSIEIALEDWQKVKIDLIKVGLKSILFQEKKRKSYYLKDYKLKFEIDKFPQIPTYLEIEAQSEKEIELGLNLLGYDKTEASSIGGKELFELYKVNPFYLVFKE